MAEAPVKVEIDDGIVTIILNRPESRNAANKALAEGVSEGLHGDRTRRTVAALASGIVVESAAVGRGAVVRIHRDRVVLAESGAGVLGKGATREVDPAAGVGPVGAEAPFQAAPAAQPEARIYFCDLTDATSLDGIYSAAARALGVESRPGNAAEQLSTVMRLRGECLLALDNFEQVCILLQGVRIAGAVVHVAANSVQVEVVVRIVYARITDVAQPVPVGICLSRVADVRAVVHVAAHAVPVQVVVDIERTIVARVA